MKRIVTWLLGTISAGVLLFGYHTSTEGPMDAIPDTVVASTSLSGDPQSAGSSEPPQPTEPAAADGGIAAQASSTFTGSTSQTRWGPVQVQIVVSGGTITDVTVPQYPNGNGKDQQINARALPVLIDRTLAAQSADIDMVSGATVTSDGYVQSLQSALDEAGL
ncbi:FMN-binding protein [Rhodococcus sp. NPDC056960]|jgi:uncharacterized protein with FMN-binding domain|uniref:FMN-binding protein n=1 Tax=Rhodococcus sp. NPDC056960 TaxID=3345982 RepID=UPI0036345654